MAVEARRGGGYRKVGGLYMVGGELSAPCGRLPHPLHVCPTCSGGIKQTRGWTWVKPAVLLAQAGECMNAVRLPGTAPAVRTGSVVNNLLTLCEYCPMSNPASMGDKDGRCGLLWIGEGFYKTPEDFAKEAGELGICRRITAIPRGFKVNETWVLLAHPKVRVTYQQLSEEQRAEYDKEMAEQASKGLPALGDTRFLNETWAPAQFRVPAIFRIFKPTRVEKIITESQSKDAAEMEKLAEAGIVPVIVPDDDADHQGSVYDSDDKQDVLPLSAGKAADGVQSQPGHA